MAKCVGCRRQLSKMALTRTMGSVVLILLLPSFALRGFPLRREELEKVYFQTPGMVYGHYPLTGYGRNASYDERSVVRAGFPEMTSGLRTQDRAQHSLGKCENVLPLPRILIVEDEPTLAENLKTFLGRRSPDVRIACDAATAVEVLKTFTPDLVVLDYSLPGIDGLRTYSEIVRLSSRKPGCIMITGFPTDSLVENARLQGIHQLLCKPFSLGELQSAVDITAEESITA